MRRILDFLFSGSFGFVVCGMMFVLTLKASAAHYNANVLDIGDLVLVANDVYDASEANADVNSIAYNIYDVVSNAKYSVDVAAYGFDNPTLAAYLLTKHFECHCVRLIIDEEYLSDPDDGPIINMLLDNIPHVIQYKSAIMHNKFVIADGSVIAFGTGNWTKTGVTLNNNVWVIVEGPLAKHFQLEFNEMWAGNFGGSKKASTCQAEGIYTVCFSPKDKPYLLLLDMIENGELYGKMYGAVFFWTLDELAVAVGDKVVSGDIEAWIIWDALGASNPYSDDEYLCNAGASIVIENEEGKEHRKMLVFPDAGIVIIGSANFSKAGLGYQGQGYNDENLVVIRDTEAALWLAERVKSEYNELVLGGASYCGSATASQGGAEWVENEKR